MSDFEKVQIGFDIVFGVIGLIGLVTLFEIRADAGMIRWYARSQYYGYTQCWRI